MKAYKRHVEEAAITHAIVGAENERQTDRERHSAILSRLAESDSTATLLEETRKELAIKYLEYALTWINASTEVDEEHHIAQIGILKGDEAEHREFGQDQPTSHALGSSNHRPWICDEPQLQEWFSSTNRARFIWLNGKPGTGEYISPHLSKSSQILTQSRQECALLPAD